MPHLWTYKRKAKKQKNNVYQFDTGFLHHLWFHEFSYYFLTFSGQVNVLHFICWFQKVYFLIYFQILLYLFFVFLFFLFFLFITPPVTYGSSQARGRAYTTVTGTWDLSRICDLNHSSQQCQILNSLREARDLNLHPHRNNVRFSRPWATIGTPNSSVF